METKGPVLAGLGGVAVLAALFSGGGKPATQETQRAAVAIHKTRITSSSLPIVPNQDGPWQAVCREYATHSFDDGPKRLSGGYVEIRVPKEAEEDAAEYTRTLNGLNEKFSVKKYLVGDLRSCIPAKELPSIGFMIATVPDPDETEMRLQFDRDIDALQKALGVRSFHYTGFWFPWRSQAWRQDGDEEKKKDDEIESEALRRQQPGVLVFRNDKGQRLLVFIVGETPTSGVNRVQMALALKYRRDLFEAMLETSKTRAMPDANPAPLDGAVPIVGPHFSASFLSLEDVLSDAVFEPSTPPTEPQPFVRLISADASSDDLIAHFQAFCREPSPRCTLLPLALSERKKEKVVFDYLDKSLRYESWQIAHLVEDESAFGDTVGEPGPSGDSSREFGLVLTFPRELSSLRSISDQQSEQIAQSGAKLMSLSNSAQPVRLSAEEPGERDRPSSYSPEEQAAEVSNSLTTIVRLLRSNKIRAVFISATNPLDRIFLLEYLHDQLPDVRAVVMDADQLETSRPHFIDLTGTVSVTSLPTLPEVIEVKDHRPTRMSFASSSQEGEFLAASLILENFWSQEPRTAEDQVHRVKDEIEQRARPISIVGESGFQPVPFGLAGEIANERQSGDLTLLSVTVVEQDGKQQNVLSIRADRENSPPTAFFSLVVGAVFLAAVHLALLFLSTQTIALELGHPRLHLTELKWKKLKELSALTWKHLYFLFVLNNQVFLLNLLVLHLVRGAGSVFQTSTALDWALWLAWIFTSVTGGISLLLLGLLVYCVVSSRPFLIRKSLNFLPTSGLASMYLGSSVWLIMTWQIGNSQVYAERFLSLSHGLSPVLPFASVVFAYALWAWVQLTRIGWVASRKADLDTGSLPSAKLSKAMRSLHEKIEEMLVPDGIGSMVMAMLVLAAVFLNVWESIRGFERPGFRLWFMAWGLLMLLVTVTTTFFQSWSIWIQLKKMLRCLELTPMREAFETLGKDGLADLKIWDLAKPQRVFAVFTSTVEMLERIHGASDQKVLNAKAAVDAIIEADARGDQATPKQSSDLNTALNVELDSAVGVLEGHHSGFSGEPWRLYLALRLVALIRYALLQIRNLVFFAVYGYMLAAISVMFYPFQGGKSLGELLSLVFAGLLIGVVVMFFGIQQNVMLGRLGRGADGTVGYSQMVFHLLSVGGVPAIALLASQFPSFAQFAFSWLRPILGAFQ